MDTAGVGAVLDQALNHSEVMQNLAYLSDMIGPRLTGSAAMKKANDWTMERFKAYGLRRAPGVVRVRRDLGARRREPQARVALRPRDHGAQLGLDGRHRRQDADR